MCDTLKIKGGNSNIVVCCLMTAINSEKGIVRPFSCVNIIEYTHTNPYGIDD